MPICSKCKGKGRVMVEVGGINIMAECGKCNGTGSVNESGVCKKCNGKKKIVASGIGGVNIQIPCPVCCP